MFHQHAVTTRHASPYTTTRHPLPTTSQNNWRCFTDGSLDEMDWSNVVAAGGAPLACMTLSPAEERGEKITMSQRKAWLSVSTLLKLEKFYYYVLLLLKIHHTNRHLNPSIPSLPSQSRPTRRGGTATEST